LKKIEIENRDSLVISKELAAALFDLSTALYPAAGSYPKENQEEMFRLFHQFCDKARGILN
jgi:hypothetical protein